WSGVSRPKTRHHRAAHAARPPWRTAGRAGTVFAATSRRFPPACRPVLPAEWSPMARTCPEFRHTLRHPDRRSFVKAGILGSLGLPLADLFRAEARASTAGRPTSAIIL